ncbi:N-methyl-L-tryptophan oxidase [Scopulibacillus darangshiensis]|uniref:N-methyl-L-tryptophan oxidase n=1 Tax=Scopulibacillus darangshiensis TaxID=442528 RepID=A0A4R2NJ15_9BACL|nr:N-methyl-L-tryptophan oxidase [Scopulibacillus darangshiensis]TCP21302.1 N-methyl-L-tryptophan oxidase [Scopulibacillus darangshiensis]
MKKQYEVIIVGAGSMGMATGYFLAKRGVSTLLIDANDPPHDRGSHHGETRTIRHAYGEGEHYVPLAIRAQELWHELEKESGEHLFSKTGVLCAGHSESSFIKETIHSAKTYALPIEIMGRDDIHKEWPGLSLPEGTLGCLETTSGVLFSEQCIKAYRKLAFDYSADLMTHTPVETISCYSNGVKVQTKDKDYYADKLIITAGAWTGELLKDIKLALQPVRKVLGWFESDDGLYNDARFPAFSFDLNNQLFYGTPSFGGSGVKIGRHDAGQFVDPNKINREFGAHHSDEEDLRRFLNNYMPRAAGRLKQGKVCMYTRTPDEDFIIDSHPEYPHVAIAGGFSGHGFKFCSVVGEILSDLCLTGRTEHDLSPFSLSRGILRCEKC